MKTFATFAVALIALASFVDMASAATISHAVGSFDLGTFATAGLAGAGLSFKNAGDASDSELKAEIERLQSEVKNFAEDVIKKIKAGGDASEELKQKADEALTLGNELKSSMTARLDELEQKMVKRQKGGAERPKSLGEQFVESEGFKAFEQSGFSKQARGGDLRVKATLTSLTTDAAGSVGDAIETTRLAGILPLPQRRMTVRDLISPGRMDGNSLEYVKETGFTNNADVVSEGAAKPSSDIKFDIVTTSARVIAHWMKASRQVLSDISQLRSIIDQRLMYGLAYVEEQQLLNGDGTGQNLNGIIPQATAYSAPFTFSGSTEIDQVRLMMLQAALAEYPATGVVMHPTDWTRMELTKDTTGRYIIGNPQGTVQPTLWGLPVVATQAMSVDKVLVGAFRLGAQLFDRWDARVEAGYVNDDFTKNLVTILAEERLALAVYRPEAFIYGDLGNVSG